ncbi:MAG: formylglycine-generating enzyme family protein [Planctomycetota bacterium]|nr:MAG: formylglycine-generating enzyme family protein [Planctomycetota bacterium]
MRSWAAAAPASQDVVLSAVDDLLGAGFRLLGAKAYEAGGVRLRVGAYEHVASRLRLHLIPGGYFVMGSERDTAHERPPRSVRVAPFFLGRTPVLQAEWDRIGGEDQRTWRGPTLPIEGVSWNEARAWLRLAGGELRLPSEAEWEYACRAGTDTNYFWGDEPSPEWAWYGDEADWTTHPPALHAERCNAFGLVDMSGNLAEWCEDTWISGYRGAPADGRPRTRSWGRLRVIRGGDGFNPPSRCRSARRGMARASDRGAGIGLRAARSLPAWPEGS